MDEVGAAIIAVLGGIVFIIGVVFIGGWVLSVCWNWHMPILFGLPGLGAWQGVGIMTIKMVMFGKKAAPSDTPLGDLGIQLGIFALAIGFSYLAHMLAY